jgi:hypothetical protein
MHLVEVFQKTFPFLIVFKNSMLLTNEEGTRSFLALRVVDGIERLTSLVEHIDQIFSRYALPTFYNPPLFHCSYAWKIPATKSTTSFSYSTGAIFHYITKIDCRIGHNIHSISLLDPNHGGGYQENMMGFMKGT